MKARDVQKLTELTEWFLVLLAVVGFVGVAALGSGL